MATVILNWLILAAILSLLSIGLSLVFGMSSVVNLAHGSLYAIGAYVFTHTIKHLGAGYAEALVASVIVSAILGFLIELSLISWLRKRNNVVIESLLLTFGLGLLITGTLQWFWGPQPLSANLPSILSGTVDVFGVANYPKYRLMIATMAVFAGGLTLILLYKSRWGLYVRAANSRPEMARSCGLRVNLLRWQVFALGAGLAGLAGALMTPLTSATPGMGNEVVVSAFIVVVVGGLGSLRGALAASFLVAAIEVFGDIYLGGALGDVLIYLLVFLSLIILPRGIYGEGRYE